MTKDVSTNKPRGFARMDRERLREVASAGGRAAHAKGAAHRFNTQEAKAAGKKGGIAISADRARMSALGSRRRKKPGVPPA